MSAPTTLWARVQHWTLTDAEFAADPLFAVHFRGDELGPDILADDGLLLNAGRCPLRAGAVVAASHPAEGWVVRRLERTPGGPALVCNTLAPIPLAEGWVVVATVVSRRRAVPH